MISKTVEQLIAKPGQKSAGLLFDDTESILWVDWREYDEEIIKGCEAIIKTGELAAECEEDSLFILYKGQRSAVPLTQSEEDRHITLLALNSALNGDYELRMAWASHGSDTAAFAPLAATDWQGLEHRYGQRAVDFAFFKLQASPNVFTEPLHKHLPQKKSWWQFWK